MPDFFRNSILFTALLLIACGSHSPTAAAESSPTPVEKIERYRKKILMLKEDIAIQQGMEQEEKRKAGTILSEIEILDKELFQHQQRLNSLLLDSEKQKRKIAEQEAELDKLKHKRNKVAAHLQKRGTAFYTMGRIGLLNATFSSRTLPDLLTLRNAFDTLLSYDRKVLSAYQHTLELGQRAQRALQLEHLLQKEFVEQSKNERQKIAEARTQLVEKLKEVRSEKKLRQQAIEELHKASEKLAAAIAQVQDEVILKQGKFHSGKGQLPMPVKNGLVATRYHQITSNAFGEQSRCDGIEIEIPDHTEVRAVSDGKVFFAGYLKGYGNTVIINHGMHYYTIISRLEEILVKKEQEVIQGEKIALSGETATLFTNGLYFEIRKKQQQQNPLEWLDSNQVHFKENHKPTS